MPSTSSKPAQPSCIGDSRNGFMRIASARAEFLSVCTCPTRESRIPCKRSSRRDGLGQFPLAVNNRWCTDGTRLRCNRAPGAMTGAQFSVPSRRNSWHEQPTRHFFLSRTVEGLSAAAVTPISSFSPHRCYGRKPFAACTGDELFRASHCSLDWLLAV